MNLILDAGNRIRHVLEHTFESQVHSGILAPWLPSQQRLAGARLFDTQAMKYQEVNAGVGPDTSRTRKQVPHHNHTHTMSP